MFSWSSGGSGCWREGVSVALIGGGSGGGCGVGQVELP